MSSLDTVLDLSIIDKTVLDSMFEHEASCDLPTTPASKIDPSGGLAHTDVTCTHSPVSRASDCASSFLCCAVGTEVVQAHISYPGAECANCGRAIGLCWKVVPV